jgi:hypothetical protein
VNENTSRLTEPRGRRLYVWLTGWEIEALRDLAEAERRQTREQAALLIVDGLCKAGVLDRRPATADR